MRSENLQELVAVLLHSLSEPIPTHSKSCLDDETVKSFLRVVEEVHQTNGASANKLSIQHTVSVLDAPEHPHVFAITFQSPIPLQQLRGHQLLAQFEQDNSLQIYIQSSHVFNTPKRLAVFDMDSTLIQQEVIDLLAAHAGVEALVSSITHRAMNGELDFSASLRERVGLLKGLPADVFESLKPSITLTPGAETLLRCLKRMGVTTALLSGGFTPLARWVGGKLGIDHIHANDLEIDAATEELTGKLAESCIIVDGARKKHLLESIAADIGVTDAAAIMSVGDGANDLPMLWAAGLGVAVNAKPKVQKDAPGRLNGMMALEDLLFLLGKTADEVEELAN